MTKIFACGFFAVRKTHQIAPNFKKHAVVDDLAANEGFFQMGIDDNLRVEAGRGALQQGLDQSLRRFR